MLTDHQIINLFNTLERSSLLQKSSVCTRVYKYIMNILYDIIVCFKYVHYTRKNPLLPAQLSLMLYVWEPDWLNTVEQAKFVVAPFSKKMDCRKYKTDRDIFNWKFEIFDNIPITVNSKQVDFYGLRIFSKN